jgi:ABC-type lipoprotein export system ATPase subunit
MLTTENLGFFYESKNKNFSFPNLQCSVGSPLLITGQSGCGKTTLLHLLAGILASKKGKIKIDNVEFSALTTAERDAFRGRNIGLVYQKAHFMAALTVFENLQLASYFGKKNTPEKEIALLAERLGISHCLHKLPARLSVGEQQRASIARAVAHRPKLILADEPTSALDDQNCAAVLALLREQAELQGAALLLVTHDGRLKSEFSNVLALNSQS